MRSYKDQRRVACAFNHNHVMPLLRYQWHLAICQDKKRHEAMGLPVYYCKFHALHIFLKEEDLEAHEKVCPENPINKVKKSKNV